MINRASVPMWGKAGQSAGPQKSLGKKVIAKVVAAFPLSKIAHWSILLRGNGWSPGDTRSCGTDPILSTQRIPRGRDLIFSTQRIPRWGDHRGAMRQKMAIFKEGNSVCRDHFFQELSFYIQKEWKIGGRCDRKCQFSKEETAFAGVQKFSRVAKFSSWILMTF